MTALHTAAIDGDTLILSKLLQNKSVNVNIHSEEKDYHGFTALHYAVDRGHPDSVKLLLSSECINVNAQVTGRFYTGWTALHLAVLWGHPEIAKLLLEHKGVNVNIKNNNGDTPLAWVEKNYVSNKQEIISLLKAYGATE